VPTAADCGQVPSDAGKGNGARAGHPAGTARGRSSYGRGGRTASGKSRKKFRYLRFRNRGKGHAEKAPLHRNHPDAAFHEKPAAYGLALETVGEHKTEKIAGIARERAEEAGIGRLRRGRQRSVVAPPEEPRFRT
jgi:hypothetical protein